MVEIPERLRREEFRFTKVKHGKKAPFHNDWPNKNFKYQELTDHDESWGVVTGYGDLIVIDFDNKDFEQKILPLLPPTYQCRSGGKGGAHLYYLCPNAIEIKRFNIKDKAGNTICDVQTDKAHIIGPGSIHESGKKYEEVYDREITVIDLDKFKSIVISNYQDAIIKGVNDEATLNASTSVKLSKKFSEKYDADDLVERIRNSLRVSEVLNHYGINTAVNPCDCPIHSSKGKHALSFNDSEGWWNCFGCGFGGSIYDLVMKKEKCSFAKALSILAEKLGLSEELNRKEEAYEIRVKQEKQKKAQEVMITGIGIAQQIDPLVLAENLCANKGYYYDKSKMWWVWNEKKYRWELGDETEILNHVYDATKLMGMTAPSFKSALLEALRMMARRNKPKPVEKSWVQLGNKIYDVMTGEHWLATNEWFVTNPLPYTPSGITDTPTFDKLFGEWVAPENIPTLYEILAFSMLCDYPIHRIIALVGRGSNGKGVFFKILNEFIGLDNVASTELEILISNRFETSRLYKKLVCEMSETNANTLRETSMLKKLSGGDMIGYEFKNKNGFTDQNYATIIMSTNSLPDSSDNTEGFFRRWMVIKFPNQFDETRDVFKEIPPVEYNNLATKLIGVARKLLTTRKFTNEGSIETRRERYKAESDPFKRFWKENIVEDAEAETPVFEFYNAVETWMRNNGYNTMTKRAVQDRVESEGVYKTRIQKYENGERTSNWWYWKGVRLKSAQDLRDYDKNEDDEKKVTTPKTPITPTVQLSSLYREMSENLGVFGVIGVARREEGEKHPYNSPVEVVDMVPKTPQYTNSHTDFSKKGAFSDAQKGVPNEENLIKRGGGVVSTATSDAIIKTKIDKLCERINSGVTFHDDLLKLGVEENTITKALSEGEIYQKSPGEYGVLE